MFAQPTPKRHFQFTLRALLLGTTIAGAALGGLWYALEPIRCETRAVAAIQHAVDMEFVPNESLPPGCNVDYLAPSTAYGRAVCWLARTPGRVNALYVDGKSPAQEFLRSVDSFGELHWLSIESEAVTDADLARLGNLRHLSSLKLYESRVSGEGLASLGDLSALSLLAVSSVHLDETALSGVSQCASVEILGLGFNGSRTIDARAFAHLQKLPRLKELSIGGGFSDEAMPELAAIRTLRKVSIHDCGLSDGGIETLRGNQSIAKLWLHDLPDVTDKSIDVFISMTSLKELYVYDTKVSAAGLKSLTAARPDIDLSPDELLH